MNRRSKTALLAVIVFSILGGMGVYHFRPLIGASGYDVEASGGLEGHVFHMLGRPDTLFIELRNGVGDVEHWFTVDVDSKVVSAPNSPGRTPYLHFNHDMSLGIPLTDPKYGEGWQINDGGSRLTFSHPEEFSVTLKHGAD